MLLRESYLASRQQSLLEEEEEEKQNLLTVKVISRRRTETIDPGEENELIKQYRRSASVIPVVTVRDCSGSTNEFFVIVIDNRGNSVCILL